MLLLMPCTHICRTAHTELLPLLPLLPPLLLLAPLLQHHHRGRTPTTPQVYVVVSGDMIRLDLTKLPPLTPRQISLLSRHGGRGSTDGGGGGGSATGSTAVEVAAASEGSVSSTLVGMSPSFLSRRLGGSATCATADGLLGTLQRARPPLRISR